MSGAVEETLLSMLADLPPGKSLSPDQVAKAIDAEGWRRVLPQVRALAVGLARQGKLVILRHNKPADPNSFKGVYRLRFPLPEDTTP